MKISKSFKISTFNFKFFNKLNRLFFLFSQILSGKYISRIKYIKQATLKIILETWIFQIHKIEIFTSNFPKKQTKTNTSRRGGQSYLYVCFVKKISWIFKQQTDCIYCHCLYNFVKNIDLLCWVSKKINSFLSFHSPLFHSNIHKRRWPFFERWQRNLLK